ncbi:rhodanese-like domain-containing protein [Vibrio hippocampi]|uniref:Thiosulfate sulfurtransferase GlpE n=1 Tax=Vibrio hippocampi TaxID=654686 RepID=A0ABN8DIL4_9VIBR|nr:rhodanese-like domain-containing protein [Vibrio hippocampi]CAH0528895.1 Thiosulfate sulfurtransferase GlpE [Vibrio hippocampi]
MLRRILLMVMAVLVSTPVLASSISEWLDDEKALIIDVRTPQEYQAGFITGAINIPVNSLSISLDQIPSDRPVVLYCRSGRRSSSALHFLQNKGYNNVYDGGGIDKMRAVVSKE